ncbi:MAG: PilZ domain-containing protein [Gemmataceae bacterium]
MKPTQELLERSQKLLAQTGELVDRSQPLMENLRTLLTGLDQLRTEVMAQSQELRHFLGGLETTNGVATDTTTPLPVKNSVVQIDPVLEQPPLEKNELPELPSWQDNPELPPVSLELTELDLPWELPVFKTPEISAPAPLAPAIKASRPASGSASVVVGTERRAIPRRMGNPTSVTYTIGEAADDPLSGWVVDRSPQGIGMLVDDALEVGAVLTVKPNAAPSECPWFKAEVRHCQPEKGQYRVGCRFQNNPSWQHLRYFG